MNLNGNRKFAESVIDIDSLLDNAIEYIQNHFQPEEIFDAPELAQWAEDNGYTKEAPHD